MVKVHMTPVDQAGRVVGSGKDIQLPAPPRVGELIQDFRNGRMHQVTRVTYNIEGESEDSATIWINTLEVGR